MIMSIIVRMEKIYKLIGVGIISCIITFLSSGCASMRPPVIKNYDDTVTITISLFRQQKKIQ